MSFFWSIISLISTACSWCGIIPWANMVSASLCSVAAAGALLDIIPGPIPGIELAEDAGLLEVADGAEGPVEQPARASAAAMAVAERVRNLRVHHGFMSPSRHQGARERQGVFASVMRPAQRRRVGQGRAPVRSQRGALFYVRLMQSSSGEGLPGR